MRKNSILLAFAIVAAGCAEQIDLTEPVTMTDVSETTTEIGGTRALTDAVYNEVTDVWMIPQADPFALKNVQAAYDKLAAGRSAQALSESQAAEFKVGKRLAPTHYALKIYPKSEEEQWCVETMKDVNVAYIPFCFSQLTQKEAARVEQSGKTRSAANTFAEKSPYTVTYDYTEATDGGPTGPVTYQLPILYTVWPAEKPLPTDLEYVVDYPVFLPCETSKTRSGNEDISILIDEALTLASGVSERDFVLRGFPFGVSVDGAVAAYDDVVGSDVPLANLSFKLQYGSLIVDDHTNIYGCFSIAFPWPDQTAIPPTHVQATVTFTYIDPQGRWKIVPDNATTIPYSVTTTENFENSFMLADTWDSWFDLTSSDYQENEIHRAVNYFFNGQADFNFTVPTTPLPIVARSDSSSAYNGFFSYTAGVPRITIYNNGNSSGPVIGTTLHELGHYAHFRKLGYSTFRITPTLIQESFASYSGWYLGEEYYVSHGATRPASGLWTITGSQHRQSWHKNYTSSMGYYSPLFIDLTDTYNQKTTPSLNRPNDNIQGVPASAIWNIVSTSTNWTQCRAALQNRVGTYYTAADFNVWIADFDYWVAQPSNQ